MLKCWLLSYRFRQGLSNYRLMPQEERLAHLMCLDTFDRGELGGRVTLEVWARALGLRDSKGLRTDKCEKLVKSLMDLGIADVNSAQGTFELRPYAQHWSRLRALRNEAESKAEGELPLCAERPLSEALSELARDKALAGGPVQVKEDWSAFFSRFRSALDRGTVAEEFPEVSADKSADGRINPPNFAADKSADKETPIKTGDLASPQVSAKSADAPIASLAYGSTKAKLAMGSAEKSAEAWEFLVKRDVRGALKEKRFYGQWQDLCEREPNYVLRKLAGALEAFKPTDESPMVENPLAYMARKAREDGKFRRV